MFDFLNNRILNLALLLCSVLFLVVACYGGVIMMAVTFGVYAVYFLLRLVLPVRTEPCYTVPVPDAEYM